MDWKIGKAAQDKLAKLGIRNAFDLLLHLPLRYEDETHLYPIADAPFGQTVQVEGVIVHSDIQYRPRKSLTCLVQDGGGRITIRFLHFYPSQAKVLAEGKTVRLLGELRHGFHGPEMVHPKYRVVGENEPLAEALTPIYPTTAGLSQVSLRKLINQALDSQDLSDTLPEALRDKLALAVFWRQRRHPAPAAAGSLASCPGRARPSGLAPPGLRRTPGAAAFHAPALPPPP